MYGRPVRELQESITSAEFAELLVYDRCYGLPDPVRQHEELMATMANLHAPRKGRPWTADEFSRRPRKPLSDEAAQQMARGLAASFKRGRHG